MSRGILEIATILLPASKAGTIGKAGEGVSTTTYEYNARLQLVKATNPDSVVEFEYDAQGRLTCERING
ncbi:RHS repeat domain-containing protein [Providencia rettgeri]|uniref:RHS repeat domain-containing protein n=1 Tax=Providencia rettgeri TaxID=587 RepID=UPI0032D9C4F8